MALENHNYILLSVVCFFFPSQIPCHFSVGSLEVHEFVNFLAVMC